jgi:hypothetical protein
MITLSLTNSFGSLARMPIPESAKRVEAISSFSQRNMPLQDISHVSQRTFSSLDDLQSPSMMERAAPLEHAYPKVASHKRNWGSFSSDEFEKEEKEKSEDRLSPYGETTLDDIHISPFLNMGLEAESVEDAETAEYADDEDDEDGEAFEIFSSLNGRTLISPSLSLGSDDEEADGKIEGFVQLHDAEVIQHRIIKRFIEASDIEIVDAPLVREWAKKAALCNLVTIKQLFVHEKAPKVPFIKKIHTKAPETPEKFAWSDKHFLLSEYGFKRSGMTDLNFELNQLKEEACITLSKVIKFSEIHNGDDESFMTFLEGIEIFHRALSISFFSTESEKEDEPIGDEEHATLPCEKAELLLADLILDLERASLEVEIFDCQLDHFFKGSYVPKLKAWKDFKFDLENFSKKLVAFKQDMADLRI